MASQQYYHNPPGVVNIETVTITIDGNKYTLTPINSQLEWDQLNAITLTSDIPDRFFPRRDDFGIWPIPSSSSNTITLTHALRDRNLSQTDYTTGSVSVTNGSQTVTGSGTSWTSAMIGRWFKATLDGYWYRVSAVGGSTSLTLESAFAGTTASGLTYVIGETPELPEETHELLAAGAASDWFAGVRHDLNSATWWNNLYWTGDGNNSSRDQGKATGGFLGAKSRYASRSNSAIVRRNPKSGPTYTDLLWATEIS